MYPPVAGENRREIGREGEKALEEGWEKEETRKKKDNIKPKIRQIRSLVNIKYILTGRFPATRPGYNSTVTRLPPCSDTNVTASVRFQRYRSYEDNGRKENRGARVLFYSGH